MCIGWCYTIVAAASSSRHHSSGNNITFLLSLSFYPSCWSATSRSCPRIGVFIHTRIPGHAPSGLAPTEARSVRERTASYIIYGTPQRPTRPSPRPKRKSPSPTTTDGLSDRSASQTALQRTTTTAITTTTTTLQYHFHFHNHHNNCSSTTNYHAPTSDI